MDSRSLSATRGEICGEVPEIGIAEEVGVDSGSDLAGNSRREHKIQRARGRFERVRVASDRGVASVERSLDIKSDPVEKRKDACESRRRNTGGVKADRESHVVNVPNGPRDSALNSGFAPAEDNCFQEASSGREFGEHPSPRPL